MAAEFSIFTPGPEHPWGDLTRELICRDVRGWAAEDIADGWSESAFEILGMVAFDKLTIEYHALDKAGELLAVGSLFGDLRPGVDRLFLDSLVVPPQHRGQGYGGKMLRRLELRAHELGAQCLTLDATKPAVSFYRRNNYELVGGTSMIKQIG